MPATPVYERSETPCIISRSSVKIIADTKKMIPRLVPGIGLNLTKRKAVGKNKNRNDAEQNKVQVSDHNRTKTKGHAAEEGITDSLKINFILTAIPKKIKQYTENKMICSV